MAVDYFFEPGLGHGLAHDPMNSIIAPRPMGYYFALSAAQKFTL